MKTVNRFRNIRFLSVLFVFVIVSVGSVRANYGAFVYSNDSRSFGVIGMAFNWMSLNAAISSATSSAITMNGRPLGARYVATWTTPGYCTGMRGLSYNGKYASFAVSRGWRSGTAAYQSARYSIGHHNYNLKYTTGYNY